MKSNVGYVKNNKGCCLEVRQLRKPVVRIGRLNEQNDFIINTMKAEIRLLRDSLTKMTKISKKALHEHDCMDELAESRIESGLFKDTI